MLRNWLLSWNPKKAQTGNVFNPKRTVNHPYHLGNTPGANKQQMTFILFCKASQINRKIQRNKYAYCSRLGTTPPWCLLGVTIISCHTLLEVAWFSDFTSNKQFLGALHKVSTGFIHINYEIKLVNIRYLVWNTIFFLSKASSKVSRYLVKYSLIKYIS